MHAHTDTSDHPPDWPEGPWTHEPDGWIAREPDGYVLLARRVPLMGHWCGYIRVPEGHPWSRAADFIDPVLSGVSVHGGVTFVERMDGAVQIGFDCAHWMDIIPGQEAYLSYPQQNGLWGGLPSYKKGRCFYRTLGYVQGECRRLLTQARGAEIPFAFADLE